MKSAKWLSEVAKYHNDWVNIARASGGGSYSEDLVQEMYLKLYKYTNEQKIIKDGKLSKGYVYFTLKSVVNTYLVQSSKVTKVPIDVLKNISNTETLEDKIAFENLCDMIDSEISNWRWYDDILFNLYKNKDVTIRGLAQGTTISVTSIFGTIKDCKAIIKDKFSDKYESYKKKDYEKI